MKKDEEKTTYTMRSVNPMDSEIAIVPTSRYTGGRKANPDKKIQNSDKNVRQLKSRLLRVKP